MSAIVLADTSVLLNVFDVPRRNDQRQTILDELARLIEAGDYLFIPMAAVFETGNHIAHAANGHARRQAATRFVAGVRAALRGEAPWKPVQLPSNDNVLEWLEAFPDQAMQEISMGDLSIMKEWESLCRKFPMSRVRIWSLDAHLQGCDRPAA
jgi:hypothetical protein